jgi:hypothetical protein
VSHYFSEFISVFHVSAKPHNHPDTDEFSGKKKMLMYSARRGKGAFPVRNCTTTVRVRTERIQIRAEKFVERHHE